MSRFRAGGFRRVAGGFRRAAGGFPRAAAALALALGVAVAAPAAAGAQQRSWELSSFHANIEVFRSGQVVVTETLKPTFRGSYNGIFRTIPVEYRTPAGFRYKLRLDVEAVTDEAGNELRHEVSREGDDAKIKVWVPGARDATRTVILRYRVPNAIRFFEADDSEEIGEPYDELYWNVTGTEWPVPIGQATARVRLPVDVEGIRAHAFTGPYGSVREDADVAIEGTEVLVRTRQPLGFREGLTIGVAWRAGVVERPGAFDRALALFSANLPLLLPFLAFFVMYRRWRERGRDPEMGSIEPRYEPPAGLSPAEAGTIIDNRPDMRDITSTIVDLAVRGYLTIEELEEEKLFGLVRSRDYAFQLARGRETWSELRPHERDLLEGMFGTSDRVEMSDLKNRFYKHLPDIKKDLMDGLVRHRIYPRRPDHVAGIYVAIGIAVGVGIFLLGGLLGGVFHFAPIAIVFAAVGTALVVIGFGVFMPARTREGTETLRHIRGFEEFLERVESDRFKRMITGPEMFEKYLPYAMAFGVEDRWAAAFDGLFTEPPQWYHGSGFRGFSTHIFVSDLGRMSSQAQTVMQTAPRSSGGSSFGGGGFSGGGFSGGAARCQTQNARKDTNSKLATALRRRRTS